MKRNGSSLVVVVDGVQLRWIYDDAARGLLELGPGQIRRASMVEPSPSGGWTADLSPVQGPILGPFPTRGEALAAERAYLETSVL